MQDTSNAARKQDIVLVHGSFHGAWCWRKLVPLLERAGHRVWAPTFTGLAERAHYGSASTGLGGHIAEIAQLLEFEDLHDVVLVGHSYAGMVLSGVAETQAARIRRLVYLDAFVPADGDTMFDHLPRHFAADWLAAARDGSGWGIPPPPPEVFGITDEADIAWARARLTPMPYRTHDEAVLLPNDRAAALARTYVWCRQSGLLEATAARIRQLPAWDFQALDTGHDVMVSDPVQLAATLLAAAGRGTGTA